MPHRRVLRDAIMGRGVRACDDDDDNNYKQVAEIQQRYGGQVDAGDLTYGEFSLDFFCRLLDMCSPRDGDVFCDVGSGTGRLVLAAAAMMPSTLSVCRGIEILPSLHQAAQKANQRAQELRFEPLHFKPFTLDPAEILKFKPLISPRAANSKSTLFLKIYPFIFCSFLNMIFEVLCGWERER